MEKSGSKDHLPPPIASARAEPRYSIATISAVIAFYWACSLSVVFLNKYILSYSPFRFPYPLFVTWFQLVVALVVLVVWGSLGKSIRAFSVIPPYEFRLDIAKRVATLTFVYVMMLAFNNLCLQYVEVTFYQVARSLTIVFNIIFTYYILGHTTNTQTLFACAIVTLGFALGSYGEINFSWAGVLFGVGSSVFVALYGIYVKKTLAYVENDQWRLLHYNTTIAIIMLFPLVVVSGEFSDMMDSVTFWYDTTFWSVMILTGLTGFLINIATFLQIKFTSPLTNTISGTAKACAQTIIAAVVIQNPISSMNGTGIFLSLGGSAYYSYVRYREMMDRR